MRKNTEQNNNIYRNVRGIVEDCPGISQKNREFPIGTPHLVKTHSGKPLKSFKKKRKNADTPKRHDKIKQTRALNNLFLRRRATLLFVLFLALRRLCKYVFCSKKCTTIDNNSNDDLHFAAANHKYESKP